MANSFSKEERVAFENLLEGFQDALVLSRNVSIYNTDQTTMERTRDVIWRPQPYISTSISNAGAGQNLSSLNGYKAFTQLAVPSSINQTRTVGWEMTALELRDALQEQRLGSSAKQKIASDINVAVNTVAANFGSLVVTRNTAAGATSGFDDVAQCEAIFNETGVMDGDRYLALNTRDYNGLAKDLSIATRSFGNQKSDKAYERAYVGMVASFDTYKLDYAPRLAAAAGTAKTIDLSAGGGNLYTPAATDANGNNVDNRTQVVTLNNNTGIAVGDCFTIADVAAVHLITKVSTGRSKTFRVVGTQTDGLSTGVGANQIRISPPLVTPQKSGATEACSQYQNCVITTPAAGKAISFTNTTAAGVNCFWHKDAIEILPGRYAIPSDGGVAVMRGSTDQGLELVMTKRFDQDTLTTKYRIDTLFGVVNKQPEMSGIILFNQSASTP